MGRRTLIRAYDFTLAPATQVLVKHVLRLGTIFYGGNFAVRRAALDEIRRLRYVDRVPRRGHQRRTAAVRSRQGVAQVRLLSLHLGAPLRGDGEGSVFRLYVRNFTSELLHRRPKDTSHVDVRI